MEVARRAPLHCRLASHHRRSRFGACRCLFPDLEVETVYDPCSPLTLAVEADLSAVEVGSVESAIQAWARVLPTQMSVGAGARATDVLPIHFESGDSFFRGIYWDAVGTISISRDRLAPETYALAIAHELGHAFGLLHVPTDERRSVMNVGNLEVVPTEQDVAAIRTLWATCGDAPPAE